MTIYLRADSRPAWHQTMPELDVRDVLPEIEKRLRRIAERDIQRFGLHSFTVYATDELLHRVRLRVNVDQLFYFEYEF